MFDLTQYTLCELKWFAFPYLSISYIMACTRPLNCFKTPPGRVVFSPTAGDVPFQVPCGKCIGCRLEHSRSWAVRCVHEAYMYENNCFVTLTYDDEHLPLTGDGLATLQRNDLTLFLKRLRKRYSHKIRYFGRGAVS